MQRFQTPHNKRLSGIVYLCKRIQREKTLCHYVAEEKSAAATLRHYRDKSQAWRKERNDTFEACTWYRDHWTRDRNIILTASGVQQDLAALERIRAQWLKA